MIHSTQPATRGKVLFILAFLAASFFLSGCLPEPGFLEPSFDDVVRENCPNEPGMQEHGGCPADTDGDGFQDYWEDQCGYDRNDPTDHPDPTADDDGDGLTNAEEAELNTSPCLSDTDSDGFSDAEDECPKQNGRDTSNGCPA